MARTVSDARHELGEFMRGDARIDFPAQTALRMPPETQVRPSAVLILFGALDRKPAHSTAGPVPPELDVLLMRRSSALRHHAGQISFPGGGVEAVDRGPESTALREAVEETGLDPAGVEVLGRLPDVDIPVSGYRVTPVVGWWRLPSEVAADHSESVEVFRVPVAELLDPAARGTSVISRGGATFRGPAFRLGPQLGGHVVWGFTGILLSTLFDRLGWAEAWDASAEFPVLP